MSAPRVEIDLDKIGHNARTLVDRLSSRGLAVTGVTKAALGSPALARTLMRAGVRGLGDSRIENIESMVAAGITAPMTLIRSPMLSQVDRVVAHADVSFNTERTVIHALAEAAERAGRTHGIVLMVELGDLREGILPTDLDTAVAEVIRWPNVELRGIGTNLACRSGVIPDASNMGELSALADSIEARFGLTLAVVSGGSSANVEWALNAPTTGRINDLRLGESILLGREPLNRRQLDGLHGDAITIVAEVIESNVKPTLPRGATAQSAFGAPEPAVDRGDLAQAILALGHQDTDPFGLAPPAGIEILGASSDHLIVTAGDGPLAVGDEVRFVPTYGALVRAMTSPFLTQVVTAAVA